MGSPEFMQKMSLCHSEPYLTTIYNPFSPYRGEMHSSSFPVLTLFRRTGIKICLMDRIGQPQLVNCSYKRRGE